MSFLNLNSPKCQSQKTATFKWWVTEIVIVVVMIDRVLFQKRRYLFKIFLFELVRRVFIQNNIIFLGEYRRERSEFDVGPGLKFINIYIQVVLNYNFSNFRALWHTDIPEDTHFNFCLWKIGLASFILTALDNLLSTNSGA